MDIEDHPPEKRPTPIIEVDIQLNEKEKQLFEFLYTFVKEKNLDVVLRSAGGWVRDKVLGQECHDIDITLDTMTGEQFMQALILYLSERGEESLISGHGVIKSNPDKSKHLETVTFKLFGYDIDVANLRSEEYADTSRIPSAMKFGTPLEDSRRRDLTVNSMFYNINEGKIEDCTSQGLEDLKYGIIRTPLEPNQTFSDDPLRILRSIRFATKYRFSIDPAILLAIRDQKILTQLEKKVSRERIKTELQKILVDSNVAVGLRVIYENNLWPIVFQLPANCEAISDSSFYQQKQLESYTLAMRAIEQLPNVLSLPIFSTDYSKEEAQLLFLLTAITYPFTAMTHKVGKASIISLPYYLLFESLKFPDKYLRICTIVSTACESAVTFQQLASSPSLDSEFHTLAHLIKKQGNTWELAIQIAQIADQLKYKDDSINVKYQNLISHIYSKNLQTVFSMKPLIDGKQIMNAFKLEKQGPLIGKIASNIFVWQASHMNLSKEDLLADIERDSTPFII